MARTRANASGRLRAGAVRIAVWPVWSGCSRRFQQTIVQLLGGSDSCSSHLGVSVPCQRYATHASNAARTNRYSSACAHPLLPGVAFAAFVGMLSIGSASQKAHLVSVLELCQLIPPRCCASLATPPEQQSHMHTPAASFCACLTALPLMDAATGITVNHSCIGRVEKAHRELQFVWRRPQTAEIRCSRNALCTTDRQPVSVRG